jgi:hypothetical protein
MSGVLVNCNFLPLYVVCILNIRYDCDSRLMVKLTCVLIGLFTRRSSDLLPL